MKILHIITSLRIGGAEVALFNRLKAMSGNNLDHLVICFYEGPIVEQIRGLGVDVWVVKGLLRGYDPVGFFRVYKIAQRFNPSIIHTALWAANIVGRLLGLILKVPVINELHGNVAHEGILRNVVEQLSCRAATKIVAVSHSVQSSYELKIMTSLSNSKRSEIAQRLITITNGIDRQDLLARIAAFPLSRTELGLTSDDFVIGAIGRLEKIKSYEVLIRSFAALLERVPLRRASIKLVMVGDGSERFFLEQLVAALHLKQNVLFLGYRMDVYRLYSIFDCFALSSQSEGLSIALLEAIALGIPVISTHANGPHDAIVSGKNGLLVPPNDIPAYAEGLLGLMQKDIVKNPDMVPLNKSFSFSLENVVIGYQNLYCQLS